MKKETIIKAKIIYIIQYKEIIQTFEYAYFLLHMRLYI